MIIADHVERKAALRERVSGYIAAQSPLAYLGCVVAFALLIRMIVVYFTFHDLTNPANGYDEFGWEMGWTGRAVALGHGFSAPFQPITGPTALVPPLYPYILAAIFKIFGLYTLTAAFVTLTINAVLSAITCIPVYGAAREVLGVRVGRWAAFAWAIYPFGIYFSAARVWDYALTAFLFACCFWWAQHLHRSASLRGWMLFGLLFGVTSLSNPSIVTMLPFLLLMAMWRRWRMGGKALLRGFVTCVAFSAVILPWSIRNYEVMHIICPLRDGFWLEFYAGNAGDTSESNPAWAHPASNPVEMQRYEQLGETAYLAEKHDIALYNVRHNKLLFVKVTARRFVRFWTGYWSFSKAYLDKEPLDIPNVPFCTVLTLLLLLGVRWWWREDRDTLLPFAILLLVFPAPYYLSHASMDYRAPIEPELVILTTVGARSLRERRRATALRPESLAEPAPGSPSSWNAARSRASL